MPTTTHTPNSTRTACRMAALSAAMVVAGLVSACATNAPATQAEAPAAPPVVTATTPSAAEEAVRTLAAARWQTLIAGDFAKAYAYAAPSYRAINPLDIYRANKQGVSVKWLSANVYKVACELAVCTVQIELESKPITPIRFSGTLKSALDEKWVLEDGKWWIFDKL